MLNACLKHLSRFLPPLDLVLQAKLNQRLDREAAFRAAKAEAKGGIPGDPMGFLESDLGKWLMVDD